MSELRTPSTLNVKNFTAQQDVRWCPGCGDYAILKAVRKTLVEVEASREDTVFISGIGCASRLPHYIECFGFHSIHGRAPAIATGVMLANPDLDIWIITGDGDGLSIGGNHLMHILRRNVNCQILLFNNEIYGLTKGQYSPTSHFATRSPSTPTGSLDTPVNPALFALGCGAHFVARAVDTQQKQLGNILHAAYHHAGASFVEIYQNCLVFNDGVFDSFTERGRVEDFQLPVEHGRPLIFGSEGRKGLIFDSGAFRLKPVIIGEDGVRLEDIIVHDTTNRTLATLLAQMTGPDEPVATGVLYNAAKPTYEHLVAEQVSKIKVRQKLRPGTHRKNITDVLHEGFTWQV